MTAPIEITRTAKETDDAITALEELSQKVLYGSTCTTTATSATDILAETLGGTDYPALLNGYKKTWKYLLNARSTTGSSQNCEQSWEGIITAIDTDSTKVDWTLREVQNISNSDLTLTATDVSIVSNAIQCTVQHTSTNAVDINIEWKMYIFEIYEPITYLVS